MASLDAAYERRAMKEGLVKEPVFDENDFWQWCIDNGYHNEDYVLDNQAELEDRFLEEFE